MKTADIVRVLTEMGIAYIVDPINPSFTVLLETGGMLDRVDQRDDWEVISLDRKFHKFVSLEYELRQVMTDLIEHEKNA